MATFQLPHGDSAAFFSDELSPAVIGSYPELVEHLDRRFRMWHRKVHLGVCNRASLWGSHLEEYERDAYFHEVVVPARGFDALIVTSALDPQTIDAGTVASLMFHHESESGTRFGDRGLALLRLIQPAFAAGVHSYIRLANCHHEFTRGLDDLQEGVLLLDSDGRVIHQNLMLEHMLAAEDEVARAVLKSEMEHVGRIFCNMDGGAGARGEVSLIAPIVREVRTGRTVYRVRATLLGEAFLGSRGAVSVLLDRVTRESPSGGDLNARFGLTSKEAEVALLLARGQRNDDIARALFISPHTARRHTERVLKKLGVRSRAQVSGMLQE